MTRRNEQGNVLVFVIVGVLLTAALVGAVVVARQFQKSGDTPVVTTSNTKDESSDKAPEETGAQSSNDQALKDALNAQSQAEKDKQAASNNSTQTKPQQQPSSSSSTTTQTNKLPETGPESALISLLGATMLVGTGFAYTRSRRLI